MVNNYTFPHADIDLQDNSAPVVPDTTILPLHLPLFVVFTEKGPIGVPVLGGSNALQAMFGSGMVNERSPFYQHPNVFLKRALPYQQVYVMRVADSTATAASLVLCCTVTPGQIPQYQRSVTGAEILGSNGLPLPMLMPDGTTVVTAAGVTLSFSVRPLAPGETISTVLNTTTAVSGGNAITYPLMAFTTDVGSAGNLAGFRLFYSSSFDAGAVANMGAMTYSFQPVTLSSTTNIDAPVYDIYNSQTETFAFKAGAYDPSTAMYYGLSDVVTNNYNGLPGLPYQFYVYSANATAIGQQVLAVSPELGTIDPNLINILSGVDQSGNTYQHMVVDATANTLLNANVVNYLQGGSDGSLSKATLEALTASVMNGTLNPQIADSFRYPFTHIYDSGFALATKMQLPAIFGLRDDVKIEFSTQDVAHAPNTAAQDQSTGSALRTMLLLNPESVDFGTQACRASIYQQCGTLSDTQIYTTIVPSTIDRMIKRCIWNGVNYVKGEPKGRPNSEVTILNIKSLNWTPTTPQQQQLSWNTGLNYIQYCDVATLFFADLLSVYPIDNSLLSSDVFVDYVAIYLKKIIRTQWTIFVGRDDKPTALFTDIAKAIDAAASFVFGTIITTSTVVSQTAVDSALGYQTTVTTSVQGNMPNRVWKVIVPITRAS
jgi:hypothetical protein